MRKKPLPLSKAYQLLEPGPVLLVTTARGGRANAMTMSWHTMMEFEPPLLGCVISDRSWTHALLRATRECVLNVPTAELAKQVVAIGNCSGRRVDKLAAFGLTALPAAKVGAPLVAECWASLECRVADTHMVRRYGFFVLEVVKAWVAPAPKNPRTLHHRGWGTFMVAGRTLRLRSRMR